MKRSTLILLVLILAVAGGFYFALNNPTNKKLADAPPDTPATVAFLGHTLNVPTGWSVYEFGTRGGILTLTRPETDGGSAPRLTLEDIRTHPEDPARFVSGWQNSLRVPGFRPSTLAAFHNPAVDRVSAPCVRMTWDNALHNNTANSRPVRIICLASNGRWKLTLSGNDADTDGLNALALQLPTFTRPQ